MTVNPYFLNRYPEENGKTLFFIAAVFRFSYRMTNETGTARTPVKRLSRRIAEKQGLMQLNFTSSGKLNNFIEKDSLSRKTGSIGRDIMKEAYK